jgi:hypothetical protein
MYPKSFFWAINMNSNRIDMTGKVFGKLTVLNYSSTVKSRAIWVALCECGTTKTYVGANLRNGNTKSCGCVGREKASIYLKQLKTTHGRTDSGAWNSWRSMHDRCLRPLHKSFYRYGSIKICDRWLNNFIAFFDDMGERPIGTTLDRIDNELNYSPDNCKWSSFKDQARNRRNSKKLTHNGETKTVAEWSEVLGIHPSTISKRILKPHLSIDQILSINDLRNSGYPVQSRMVERGGKRVAEYYL